MPTPDYTSQSEVYRGLLNGQNRNNASAAVSNNDQFDRDNLLHFLEENFQSNGQGVSIEKFRALIHTLIKSVNVQKDDYSRQVLCCRSARVSSAATNRSYFVSPYYGFMYTYWSTYFVGTFDESTLPSVSASNGPAFPSLPLDAWDLTATGTIQNASSTGDVQIFMCYADMDDATNANLQNTTFIGTTTVDCAITDTDYAWTIQFSGKIPKGKKILTFVRNAGWAAGNEILYFNQNITFSTHNTNYSQA